MTLYIESRTAGRSTPTICQFENKEELRRYANDHRSFDGYMGQNKSVPEILDALYDCHVSTSCGSVSHWRISRIDAIRAIRDGAINHTFLL